MEQVHRQAQIIQAVRYVGRLRINGGTRGAQVGSLQAKLILPDFLFFCLKRGEKTRRSCICSQTKLPNFASTLLSYIFNYLK
jgi:hypothetical protein